MGLRERSTHWRWPDWVLALVAAIGIVAGLRIVFVDFSPFALALTAGLSSSWIASVTALLLVFSGGLLRWRRRDTTLLDHPIVPRLLVMVGGGLTVSALAVFFELDAINGVLLTSGLVVGAYGVWRRTHPMSTHLVVFSNLALVVLAFQIPRESGQLDFSWWTQRERHETSWQESQSCQGSNTDNAALSIAAHRPPYALIPHQTNLTGDVGEAIGRRLAVSDVPAHGTARVEISGQLHSGSLLCHLPGHRAVSLEGSVNLDIHYGVQSPVSESDVWSLDCFSNSSLDVTVTLQRTGISSCRGVIDALADVILASIHEQARAVTGN